MRQTWQANPRTDICYVYTLTGGMVKELQDGKYPRAASAMEAVADHYDIPSLHVGVEVVRRLAADTLVFKAPPKPTPEEQAAIGTRVVFSHDDVHPLDAGHAIYAEVVARRMPMLLAGTAAAHVLKAPLMADNHERARLLPIDGLVTGDGWVKLDAGLEASLERCYSAIQAIEEHFQKRRAGKSLIVSEASRMTSNFA